MPNLICKICAIFLKKSCDHNIRFKTHECVLTDVLNNLEIGKVEILIIATTERIFCIGTLEVQWKVTTEVMFSALMEKMGKIPKESFKRWKLSSNYNNDIQLFQIILRILWLHQVTSFYSTRVDEGERHQKEKETTKYIPAKTFASCLCTKPKPKMLVLNALETVLIRRQITVGSSS